MPLFTENLGLEGFMEDEESFVNLVRFATQGEKVFLGYSGGHYVNRHLGDVQLVARCVPDGKGDYEVVGLDTHCAGRCVWKSRIIRTMKNGEEDDDALKKAVMVQTLDNESMAIIHVVNADVLPSFKEDEVISLQVVALPKCIEYFKDEDEYNLSVEPAEDGNKYMIGENRLLPTGIFSKEDRIMRKSIVQYRGIVKKLLWGAMKLGDETIHPFVNCIVETQFGDLEVLHRVEDVEESQRENMEVGATVHWLGWLSGDAAILTYENGIVHDHENHLKLLAYTLADGDPERMRSVLAEDFIYSSETSSKEIDDVDAFIDWIKEVKKSGRTCHTQYATIEGINARIPDHEYPVGTRCVLIAYGSSDSYDQTAFVGVNDAGNINKIHISNNIKYQFLIDS